MLFAKQRQAAEAVENRHLKVEENEVRIRPSHERRDLCAGHGGADDLELPLVLEDLADRFDDERVIVRDDDALLAVAHCG
jgi:hypothetical protein